MFIPEIFSNKSSIFKHLKKMNKEISEVFITGSDQSKEFH